jgi:hypothetical protein
MVLLLELGMTSNVLEAPGLAPRGFPFGAMATRLFLPSSLATVDPVIRIGLLTRGISEINGDSKCLVGEFEMLENRLNAAVSCSYCGAEIRFFKEPKLPEGFSLACPKCARRKIYALVDIHTRSESEHQSRS